VSKRFVRSFVDGWKKPKTVLITTRSGVVCYDNDKRATMTTTTQPKYHEKLNQQQPNATKGCCSQATTTNNNDDNNTQGDVMERWRVW
jgi:hypothetical protein